MDNAPLILASMGYPVLPCAPNSKIPRTAHGLLDATTDDDTIAGWMSAWPDSNWAVRTDGLLVVDVDPVEGAANPWPGAAELSAGAGAVCMTPRGGRHLWYRQPEGATLRSTAGAIARGVDTRSDGGYVLVPPSSTPAGRYVWAVELGPREGLPEAPESIVGLLRTEQRKIVLPAGPAEPAACRAAGVASRGFLWRHGPPQPPRGASVARRAPTRTGERN
jgi:hypothetical protein